MKFDEEIEYIIGIFYYDENNQMKIRIQGEKDSVINQTLTVKIKNEKVELLDTNDDMDIYQLKNIVVH